MVRDRYRLPHPICILLAGGDNNCRVSAVLTKVRGAYTQQAQQKHKKGSYQFILHDMRGRDTHVQSRIYGSLFDFTHSI
jgi:hypothetical protein